MLTWPRPPARQKFLFSAEHGLSCQLGHQSIRQVPEREEASAQPLSQTDCSARSPGSLDPVSHCSTPRGPGPSRTSLASQVGGRGASSPGPPAAAPCRFPALAQSPALESRIHCLISVPLLFSSSQVLQVRSLQPSSPIWPPPTSYSKLTLN